MSSVTADDQRSICQYSSYLMDALQFSNDIKLLESKLQGLKDALEELELVLDEEEPLWVRFGSGAVQVPFEEAKGMLERQVEEVKGKIEEQTQGKRELEAQMEGLKRTLTGKFGDAIRLD